MTLNKTAYDFAFEDFDTVEWGDGDNPKIVQYFKDVGHEWVKDDETPWCAAFVGAMLKKAGQQHTGKLDARSYLTWGEEVALDDARQGDIVVFFRGDPGGWKGHVGFFESRKKKHILVLGGNQDSDDQVDRVNIRSYPISRLLGVRRHT